MNALDCAFGQEDGFQLKAKISDFGGGGRERPAYTRGGKVDTRGDEPQVALAESPRCRSTRPAADSISGVEGFACEDCRGDGEVNGFTCRRCGGKGVQP